MLQVLLLYFIHGLVSGVSHGLGLGLGFSHIVELWFWCLQGLRLLLDDVISFIVQDVRLWLYFIHGLVSETSHGLAILYTFVTQNTPTH